MGLVIIGMALCFALYVIVATSLFALFVRSMRKSAPKAGFLKFLRSWRGLTVLFMILICGLPVLFLYLSSLPRSGDELFKQFILNPIPKSVVVLDSYDGGPNWDPDSCLHFKISPGDFGLILESKKWDTGSDANAIIPQCELGKPAWDFVSGQPFPGGGSITYTFSPHRNISETLIVNAQTNEAYYFFYDGNAP